MPYDCASAGIAIHASAVAIGARALLITGPSGAGKSHLAMALVARSTANQPILLIGDDRILLRRGSGGVQEARPHPRIAGFVERRGFGLVAVPWRDRAPVYGLVCLGADDVLAAASLRNLPLLRIVPSQSKDVTDVVLDWWHAGLCGADAAPPGAGRGRPTPKVWNW